MSWRNDLQKVTLPDGRRLIGASFRGVAFFVEGDRRTGGRRLVTHEFPLREDPYIEDLGRRARTFAVEGYLVGPDYLVHRDALLAALEDVSGPGKLVHPFHGVRRASCAAVSTRETIADGGMVLLSIEFAEAPAQALAPAEDPDLADVVARSVDAALLATAEEFADGYSVDELPTFALASAAAALEALSAELGARLAPIVTSTQELARLNVEIRSLTGQATSLVRQPGAVLVAFGDTLAALTDTVEAVPGAVLRALLDAYAADTGPLAPVTTGTRLLERANQEALTAALQRILVVEAARLAPRAAFDSHEEATATRDEIAELLEEQAATATDAAYPALVQLRSDLVRAVPGDAVLARLRTIERRVTTPSLVLSYQLHGTVAQEADILARNRVRHPGFLVGELEVLTDE